MVGKQLWVFVTIQAAVLILLLLANALLLVRQQRSNAHAREQLVDEIRSNSEGIETVRSGLLRLAEDSGQIRDSLMLPRRDYSFLQEEGAEGDLSTKPNPFAAYFSALEELVEYNRQNGSYERIRELLDREGVRAFLREESLRAESADQGRYRISRRGEPLAFLTAGEEPGTFALTIPQSGTRSVQGAEELIDSLRNELRHRDELARRREQAAATLRDFASSPEVRRLLEEQELYTGSVTISGERVSLPVIKGRNEEIFSIDWNPSKEGYSVGDQAAAEPTELLDRLKNYLAEADLRSDQERLVDSRVEELLELFDDPGFQGYLDTLGLSVRREPRNGEEYVYFELRENDGEPVGSFAVQRLNGTVWIMDEDDVPLTSLRRLQEERPEEAGTSSRELDREIPEVSGLLSRQGEETFLVVGSHEQMADTVILAHVNHQDESIQLISVPRDLYYRGRKINVLYPNYGGQRFAAEISEIAGLEVSGYVAIDMYAFIDVVNILGGVEVTLREPLIDPTYRTKENGRWSTLYYPAGTHRLSGIEALRLARSRHGDSDFGRAERQQAILGSLKYRLRELGAKEMGTLYELVSTLFRYVESNLSSYEVARLLAQARSYEITEQAVLNTDNILYHTYSNLYYSGKSAEEVDEDFYKGAWILLPKDDDWNAIRWYIRELLDEEAA